MTEQPDTASIRERWAAWSPAPMAPGGTILALCDALDAARAERDSLAAIVDMAGEWPKAMARAEAAEAHIALCGCNTTEGWDEHDRFRVLEALSAERWAIAEEYRAAKVTAEARIAAALELCYQFPVDVDSASVRRALSEGTGQ